MSHQSGIRASQELNNLFVKCKANEIRLIVIKIVEEELRPVLTFNKSKSWLQDYAAALSKFSTDKDACYVLIRLDSGNASGDDWLFITYAPDSSPVRQRMLYASTRATLKSEFGAQNIKYDIQISSKKDLSAEMVKSSLEKKGTVLSIVEYGLMQAKLEESNPNNRRFFDSRQPLKGVIFPVDQEALEKFDSLANGEINYVQLSVDTLNEAIKLERAETIKFSDFQSRVPRNKARYHFLAHDNHHQQQTELSKDGAASPTDRSILFVYTIPPSMTSSIKDRMLYSSCKASFLDAAERAIGMTIARKIEVDSGEKFDEHFLLDEFYPKRASASQNDSNGSTAVSFAKPQGPKNQRGARRINKVEA